MFDLLENFWKWAEITSEEYAKTGIDQLSEKAEFYYPYFEGLLEYAQRIVDQSESSIEDLNNALTIMGLDNEDESILQYITDYCSETKLHDIIDVGLTHMQPEARWQIAELIYRRKPKGYRDYLLRLSKDDHHYVRKRATNAITYLNEEGFWNTSDC